MKHARVHTSEAGGLTGTGGRKAAQGTFVPCLPRSRTMERRCQHPPHGLQEFAARRQRGRGALATPQATNSTVARWSRTRKSRTGSMLAMRMSKRGAPAESAAQQPHTWTTGLAGSWSARSQQVGNNSAWSAPPCDSRAVAPVTCTMDRHRYVPEACCWCTRGRVWEGRASCVRGKRGGSSKPTLQVNATPVTHREPFPIAGPKMHQAVTKRHTH
jgi:hypothetical protein